MGEEMKFVIFGGTPGSGKTSVIKHVIKELKDLKIHYVKFACLATNDDTFIKKNFGISTSKEISGDICPDHWAVKRFPEIIEKHKDKDLIIIETAGLCLRCAPYINEGFAIAVLNITSGKPSNYGPLLTSADMSVVTRCDMISQAEREIFRAGIQEMNKKSEIIEFNGLTGEGAIDVAEAIREMSETRGKLNLRGSMPTAVCGYCYGNTIVDPEESHKRYSQGKELKGRLPGLNCGDCGFRSCNEFVRAVLDGKCKESKCPYIKPKVIQKSGYL